MIHAQAPTKALAWKMVELFDRFVLFCTYGQTPLPEIMNHFSSLCFGLCSFVDQNSDHKCSTKSCWSIAFPKGTEMANCCHIFSFSTTVYCYANYPVATSSWFFLCKTCSFLFLCSFRRSDWLKFNRYNTCMAGYNWIGENSNKILRNIFLYSLNQTKPYFIKPDETWNAFSAIFTLNCPI